MATYDLTVGSGIPALAEWREFIAEATFNASVQNLAQNDVAQLIAVPAKTIITGVFWEIETVEGASRNFAIGDGSDTDGYITTTTANSLATGTSGLSLTEGTPNTITGYSNGKYYSAADTIDVLAVTSGGLTACKLRVIARGYCFA